MDQILSNKTSNIKSRKKGIINEIEYQNDGKKKNILSFVSSLSLFLWDCYTGDKRERTSFRIVNRFSFQRKERRPTTESRIDDTRAGSQGSKKNTRREEITTKSLIFLIILDLHEVFSFDCFWKHLSCPHFQGDQLSYFSCFFVSCPSLDESCLGKEVSRKLWKLNVFNRGSNLLQTVLAQTLVDNGGFISFSFTLDGISVLWKRQSHSFRLPVTQQRKLLIHHPSL